MIFWLIVSVIEFLVIIWLFRCLLRDSKTGSDSGSLSDDFVYDFGRAEKFDEYGFDTDKEMQMYMR